MTNFSFLDVVPTRVGIGSLLAISIVASSTLAADPLSFNRDVRPILSDACFYCHGPDSHHREADLRLDVQQDAYESAIVPGDAEASELIMRIVSDDLDSVMPPADSGKSLTPEQLDILQRWVDQGAVYDDYWAYVPPRRHLPPVSDDPLWNRDLIDQYVRAGIDQQGLQSASLADPVTLIRRLSFDLTGLPPSTVDVTAYTNNPSPQAYARLVDKMLASPAFGERMAVYWLDLVRYADTVGYHGDQDHNISPYRDYVIESLNRNLPLDQFAREQIAGDLLSDPTTDQVVATGYNRLLQTSHEGGVQPKEYLEIYAADRVRNFSAVWMGATVGCAQCHDHKYDPYSAKDFYSLSAFFADIDEAQHFKVGTNSLPTRRPPEISVLGRWQRELLSDLDDQMNRPDCEADERASLQRVSQRLADSGRLTMVTSAVEPREIRVLPRGNWLDESGDIVTPAVPAFLPQIQTTGRRHNRADLANWLTDPKSGVGGLTARVFVNRFWYLMFGRGLSSSLADFGGQGEPPSHPELLDQLTLEFIDSGWDVKDLLRRLVHSRTYRQSSVVSADQLRLDPGNRWFARQSRYRLEAEMVRDNVLAVSGLLVRDVGGDRIKPYQPAGYYRHMNFPTRKYSADVGSNQWRRGVYVHWQRQFLHPMLKSLDAPSREECTAQRPRSNTPLEALVLMNDPSMVESAMAMAIRFGDESAGAEPQCLSGAFTAATSRRPDDWELDLLVDQLRREREEYGQNPASVAAMLAPHQSLADASSMSPVEIAAWTATMRTILNLYETVTRN